MNRVLLFAMIGGALAVFGGMLFRLAWARFRAEAAARARRALLDAQDASAREEPGGHPENPIAIPSSSVVESKAAAMPCARCGASPRVLEHQARTIGEVRLRVAVVECAQCGNRREVFFRLPERA